MPTPLSYLPDLFYRPQSTGAQLGYANQVPDTATIPTPTPAPAVPTPAPTPAPTAPAIPQIGPGPALGYATRQAMSPTALGDDPIAAVNSLVLSHLRTQAAQNLMRRLLMSVLQVRPDRMGMR